jgi:hypothetical protein
MLGLASHGSETSKKDAQRRSGAPVGPVPRAAPPQDRAIVTVAAVLARARQSHNHPPPRAGTCAGTRN